MEMKNLSVKKVFTTAALTVGAMVSSSAFAVEGSDTIKTAINSAVTSGQSNVSLTVSGVIGLAALGFGVGMIVSFLRR